MPTLLKTKKKKKRILPQKEVLDIEFVSAPSLRRSVEDDLLFNAPSEHDRDILSELWGQADLNHRRPQVNIGKPQQFTQPKTSPVKPYDHLKQIPKEKQDANWSMDLSQISVLPTHLQQYHLKRRKQHDIVKQTPSPETDIQEVKQLQKVRVYIKIKDFSVVNPQPISKDTQLGDGLSSDVELHDNPLLNKISSEESKGNESFKEIPSESLCLENVINSNDGHPNSAPSEDMVETVESREGMEDEPLLEKRASEDLQLDSVQLQDMEDEPRNVELELQELVSGLQGMKSELRNMVSGLQRMELGIQDMESELQESELEWGDMDSDLQESELDSQDTDSESELQDVDSGTHSIESEMRDLEMEIRDMGLEIQDMVSGLQNMESGLQGIESELRDIESELQESKLQDMELDSQDVEPELQEVQSELQEVQSELQEVEPELQEVQSELQEVQSELQVVEPELQEMELESNNVESETILPELMDLENAQPDDLHSSKDLHSDNEPSEQTEPEMMASDNIQSKETHLMTTTSKETHSMTTTSKDIHQPETLPVSEQGNHNKAQSAKDSISLEANIPHINKTQQPQETQLIVQCQNKQEKEQKNPTCIHGRTKRTHALLKQRMADRWIINQPRVRDQPRIRTRRKERLLRKIHQPYIVRKKIKPVRWEVGTL
ncbi:hypothetical protein BD560DRAFT_447285 [Blakeslea trispora]|nr:hypothetical protein BD560DRAFT_447285 [Blakeslea trispora]